MKINFIPNDPLALADDPLRRQEPLPNRPRSRAAFTLDDRIPGAPYDPGTPEFLWWQCREAALLSLRVWEEIDGPVAKWARARRRKTLALVPDQGVDLNAYYDGQSLSFFHATQRKKTTYSGASTDVVAHEAGHALLDVICPDLWDSTFTETAAFHEAFGDCMAIVVALSDRRTRRRLLRQSPDLGRANFVEATAEDLADGVRRHPRLGPRHPASKPRRALNDFVWRLPTTLPASGGPDDLTSEVHSFGRVFSGCFYDCVRNIFASPGTASEAALWSATVTATRLLIQAAREAPKTPRFFQAVGRAMVLADQAQGGQNRLAVRDAFARHGISLGSSSLVTPRATLAGRSEGAGAKGRAVLSAATRRDLRERLGLPSGPMDLRRVEIAGTTLVEALTHREVPLGRISPRLRGVVARVAEPVLVGDVADRRTGGARAALVSALPEPKTDADEVHAFVETLLANGAIAVGGPRRALGLAWAGSPDSQATHGVRPLGKKKLLVRLRFA